MKYNGETLNGAYTMRGMAKEGKEDYLAALDDFQKAGEIIYDENKGTGTCSGRFGGFVHRAMHICHSSRD